MELLAISYLLMKCLLVKDGIQLDFKTVSLL